MMQILATIIQGVILSVFDGTETVSYRAQKNLEHST